MGEPLGDRHLQLAGALPGQTAVRCLVARPRTPRAPVSRSFSTQRQSAKRQDEGGLTELGSRLSHEELARYLVPDEIWDVVKGLIPPHKVRRQGGGMSRVDDRAVFTSIVYVLRTRCAWMRLPVIFAVTVPTAHRRFVEWSDVQLWSLVHKSVVAEIGSAEALEWSSSLLEAAQRRAPGRGSRRLRVRR
jgi:transposase